MLARTDLLGISDMWATPLSEYGRIKRVALRRPAQSFTDQARLDAQWQALNYTGRPDYAGAQSQYETLTGLLRQEGSEIDFLPADPSLTIDSIYVRDAAIVGPSGIILCNVAMNLFKLAKGSYLVSDIHFVRRSITARTSSSVA